MKTKEYRKIDLNDWVLTGGGATAESFFHKTDDSIMLKVFTGSVTKTNYAEHEFNYVENVIKLGIKTPKALEIVDVDGRLGIIYERVKNKKSFSKLCHDDPKNIEVYAKRFAQEAKELNKIECDTTLFPSIKEVVRKCVNSNRYFSKRRKNQFISLLNMIPDTTTCLHGDLHSGNLIIAENCVFVIDLGAFCYGNPIFDVGGAYFFYKFHVGRHIAKDICHMNGRQLTRFWNAFIREYYDTNDKKQIKLYERKALFACLAFTIYTMEIEHYTGFLALIASYVIRVLTNRVYRKNKRLLMKSN